MGNPIYLSPHFTLEELTDSETALRYHIDNTPGEKEKKNLILLSGTILEPLRGKVGPINITSGFRCLKLNRILGSKDTSYHIKGLASDLKVRGMKPIEVCQMIINLRLPFSQVIHEYGVWCHVAATEPGTEPERRVMTIDKLGVRTGLWPVR